VHDAYDRRVDSSTVQLWATPTAEPGAQNHGSRAASWLLSAEGSAVLRRKDGGTVAVTASDGSRPAEEGAGSRGSRAVVYLSESTDGTFEGVRPFAAVGHVWVVGLRGWAPCCQARWSPRRPRLVPEGDNGQQVGVLDDGGAVCRAVVALEDLLEIGAQGITPLIVETLGRADGRTEPTPKDVDGVVR
jgi:hypothetical protein